MALEAHVCLIHGMELQIDTKKLTHEAIGFETKNALWFGMNWIHVEFHANASIKKHA